MRAEIDRRPDPINLGLIMFEKDCKNFLQLLKSQNQF